MRSRPDYVRLGGCLATSLFLGVCWGLAIGSGVLVYRLVVR